MCSYINMDMFAGTKNLSNNVIENGRISYPVIHKLHSTRLKVK